jgi:hypothetical protein
MSEPEVPPADPPAEPARFVLTFASLVDWCEHNEYEFQANDEREQIAIRYGLMEKSTPLMIIPQWENGVVVFAMRQPYQVPTDRVDALLTATNRLNSMSFMGAWSMNADTRELFFRAALPVENIHYTHDGVLAVARAVVGHSEAATPTLHAIAMEGADVETALAALIK